MTTLRVSFEQHSMSFRMDDVSTKVPVGIDTLNDTLRATDPPAPEDLTNAIGLVQDHLEDASREIPMLAFTTRIEVAGIGVHTVAAVEVGSPVELPLEVGRLAAEEVFRTLVTERRAQRRRNPGLEESMVDDVLGVVCALVALMRFLHADAVWMVAP